MQKCVVKQKKKKKDMNIELQSDTAHLNSQ